MTIDFTNPCAVLASLKQAQFELMTGKAIASVAYDGKTVSYSRGDLPALERAIAKYEVDCAAASGTRKHFALRAGGM